MLFFFLFPFFFHFPVHQGLCFTQASAESKPYKKLKEYSVFRIESLEMFKAMLEHPGPLESVSWGGIKWFLRSRLTPTTV